MKANALQIRPSQVNGTVPIPGSKSVTHRSFVLAAQATGPCTVLRPLLSADTCATLAALHAMGARIHLDADHPEAIQFLPARLAAPRQSIDCANSGTTLRLLAGTAARLGQPTTLTGDASLRSRPNGDLLTALRTLGVRVEDQNGRAPITVQGPLKSGPVSFPGPTSSQFASSLLMALPFVVGDSTVDLQAPVSSSPYLDVTLDVAARAGLTISEAPAPGRRFQIPGSQAVTASSLAVDGDWSSAAVPLAAAAITRGTLAVTGLSPESQQGDRRILALLESFGAKVTPTHDGARVVGAPLQSPGTIAVAATPDLFPILTILAAVSRGSTTFTGGAALRSKETDRIAAMSTGLRAMGIKTQERPDGLTVEGGKLVGTTVTSCDDHRVHMAFVVAGLVAEGITTVEGPAMTDVSFPGFHEALESAGARFTLLQGNRTEVSL